MLEDRTPTPPPPPPQHPQTNILPELTKKIYLSFVRFLRCKKKKNLKKKNKEEGGGGGGGVGGGGGGGGSCPQAPVDVVSNVKQKYHCTKMMLVKKNTVSE